MTNSNARKPILETWLTDQNSAPCAFDEAGILKYNEDPDDPLADDRILQKALSKKAFAYGGFLEKRKLYERSHHFKHKDGFRNVHLGTDIWGKAGTPLYAPFDLEIHSYNDNKALGDYGPTVIFKGNEQFPYILMGHLSRNDLSLWEEKQVYRAGDLIGHFGQREENGGWYPHVHLQIMKDMMGYSGDFPGVWAWNQLNEIQHNLVDPEPLFLNVNHQGVK